MGRKAHVFLGRKAVTIESLWPWVTLTGKYRGTAVPHCHTQTTAWLDKSKEKKDKMLNNAHKNYSNDENKKQTVNNRIIKSDL